MKKIESFCVDHRNLEESVYISRVDGDVVTYDLRFCKPNTGILMNNAALHTAEHLFATFVRNSDIEKEVLYFGPMGCQTGFYLLVRDTISAEKVLSTIKAVLAEIIDYDGPVFGSNEVECGNYRNLDLSEAKKICSPYYEKIKNLNRIISYKEVK
jgi:S-ribosylhomocysteine lyase